MVQDSTNKVDEDIQECFTTLHFHWVAVGKVVTVFFIMPTKGTKEDFYNCFRKWQK